MGHPTARGAHLRRQQLSRLHPVLPGSHDFEPFKRATRGEIASITPLLTGFVVATRLDSTCAWQECQVDRHRLQEQGLLDFGLESSLVTRFNVSWSESEDSEVILHTMGKMNMARHRL